MPGRTTREHGHTPVPTQASTRTETRAAADGTDMMAESVLDCGIHVLSEYIPSVRSASVGVWFRQGGAHEPLRDTGVSHLLEHMVFKGTERRSAAEIAMALEGLGGSLDAYTSCEHTSYQARVLDDHLGEALDVLADLVLDPLLRAEDLELEREVVLEEVAQVEDTPDDLVFELHSDLLWRGHPYGRSILGTKESVAGMSIDTLRDLHARTYCGENLIVAAAGNVRHERLVESGESLSGARARVPPTDAFARPGRHSPRRGAPAPPLPAWARRCRRPGLAPCCWRTVRRLGEGVPQRGFRLARCRPRPRVFPRCR